MSRGPVCAGSTMPEALSFPLRHGPPRLDPATGAWTLTRHADVAAVLAAPATRMRDPTVGLARLASAAGVDAAPLLRLLRSWAVLVDPPEHNAVRGWLVAALRPIAPAFAPAAVEAAVADLIGAGACELDVCDVAARLPVALLARGLGVEPARVEAVAAIGSRLSMTWHAAPTLALARVAVAEAAALEAATSALMAEACVPAGEAGAPAMDPRHALGFLVIAAIETTATLAANALALCLVNPAARAIAVERRPLGDVIRRAGPVRFAPARNAGPMEKALAAIPPGAALALDLAQANHDPAVFAAPFAVDAGRRERSLAFGVGAHACIGAVFARDVLGAFLAVVLARRARLVDGEPGWTPHPWLHRVESYAVTVEGGATGGDDGRRELAG